MHWKKGRTEQQRAETQASGKELTVPARAEPRGERPGGPGGGGGGLHSGVVPLPGDRGDAAEVTALPLDALAACHVRPVRLSVTDRRRGAQEVRRRDETRPQGWSGCLVSPQLEETGQPLVGPQCLLQFAGLEQGQMVEINHGICRKRVL